MALCAHSTSNAALIAVLDALLQRLRRHANDSRVITPTFNVGAVVVSICRDSRVCLMLTLSNYRLCRHFSTSSAFQINS